MIPNISRGASFAGALRYDLNRDKGYLLDTNCASRDANNIAIEMEIQAASSRTKQPLHHVSLRCPPGEVLSEKQWLQVREKYMQKMGFTESHQFAATRHTDISDGDHIHIVINTVDTHGKVAPNFQEKRSQEACRQIEKEMNLKQLENHTQCIEGKMNLVRAALHESIHEVKGMRGNLDELKKSLAKRGFELKVHMQSTGRIRGASISDNTDGKTWKMSEIYCGKGGLNGVLKELSGDEIQAKNRLPKYAKQNHQITQLMMNPTKLLNTSSLVKMAVKSAIKGLEL